MSSSQLEVAELQERVRLLRVALRETVECLHDVASGNGGWAWEEVIESAFAALEESEDE